MKQKWTKEKCREAALKCKYRTEFYRKYPGAYNVCLKNNWLDEVCSHMKQKVRGLKWTKEKCKEVALKCKYRTEFNRKYPGAHNACSRNKWLPEVCSHMKPYFNDDTKSIYALEFSNKVAYIGLSMDPLRRFKEHIRTTANGCVRKYIDKHNNEIPTLKILCEGLDADNVGKKENDYIEIYKQNGFKLLNVAPAGSLGNPQPTWTKEKCREAALECKYRTEFGDKYPGAYCACRKNKWLPELCSHMERGVRRPTWTKEKCKEVALKCKYRSEFMEKHPGAYNACCKNKWLPEMCSHMEQKVRRDACTKEKCKEVALKCKSRTEFKEKHPTAYSVCCKNKWLPEVCSHMKRIIKKPHNYYWTKEKCKEVALKCKSRTEFKEKHPTAYNACWKNGWLDEVCSHMELRKQPNGYWTKEKCKEVALKCKSRTEFSKKYKGAYDACWKNGWLDEVCSHMNIINKSVDGDVFEVYI